MNLPGGQFAQLVSKHWSLPSDGVTPEIVAEFAKAAGFAPTDETVGKVMTVLSKAGSEAIGAWLSNPDNRQKMRNLLSGEENNDILLRCPHCHNLVAIDPKSPMQ
jgi:hypothetical protein